MSEFQKEKIFKKQLFLEFKKTYLMLQRLFLKIYGETKDKECLRMINEANQIWKEFKEKWFSVDEIFPESKL